MNNTTHLLDEKKFHQIKSALISSEGISYIQFKKKLVPNYFIVWCEILTGWVSFFIIIAALIIIPNQISNILIRVFLYLLCSFLGGYIILYLANFFHEASHFNLLRNKKKNDLFANISIGILLGQSIKHYRIIHWEHHINLGTPNDTENSYFNKLTLKYILSLLAGVKIYHLFMDRNKFTNTYSAKFTKSIINESRIMLVAGFVFHISFLGYFIYSHLWLAIASWVLIFFSFFPLFNGIRQLLEHRSDINSDYLNPASTENTKLSRLFNNSIIAKTFGSAGFNRHLLHHLEPQISYTNLGQLEEFLLHTELADEILQTETTYRKAFIKLIGS